MDLFWEVSRKIPRKSIPLMVGGGVFVGFVAGIALVSAFLFEPALPLFILLLCIFHLSEFFCIALTAPQQLTFFSFVFFHSPQFMVAMTIAVTEFAVEAFLFPSLKFHPVVSLVAFVVCLGFQAVRTVAMTTAKSNFNHFVETSKRADHVLVSNGIYSVFRHPAYFGWFWWSVVTQIVLLNPISVVLYAVASWYFFHDRIPGEEEALVEMFGDEYVEYRKKTIVGIPFV